MNKVSVIMGSDSDLPLVTKALHILRSFGIDHEVKILSAHRSPELVKDYVKSAVENGTKVFIGVAGKAAHLSGVIASYTTYPVIGLPVKTPDLGGMDSLLSTVQMPSGIPVATVAVDGGENAALLAVQILSISDESLREKLATQREDMEKTILDKNEKLKAALESGEV